MSDKVTPGPWEVRGYGNQIWQSDEAVSHECGDFDGPCACTVLVVTDPDVGDANARLIAASPDLLAAAKLTVLHFERTQASGGFQGDDEHEAWTALSKAIAKAESK